MIIWKNRNNTLINEQQIDCSKTYDVIKFTVNYSESIPMGQNINIIIYQKLNISITTVLNGSHIIDVNLFEHKFLM